MNDGGPSTTITLWAIWKPAANNSPITIAMAVLMPFCWTRAAINAAATPDSAAIERSISPMSSTKTRPSATRPVTVICRVRFDRLRADRKTSFGSLSQKKPQMSTNVRPTVNDRKFAASEIKAIRADAARVRSLLISEISSMIDDRLP